MFKKEMPMPNEGRCGIGMGHSPVMSQGICGHMEMRKGVEMERD